MYKRQTDTEEIAGHGIKAVIDGKTVLLGNEKLMKSESIFYTPCKSMGTVVYVACNGVFEGAVVISDTIKDGAKEAIHDMKQVGVRHTVMLTGDRKEAAETVAQALGIDEVHAELLPGGKVEQVEALLKAEKEKERLLKEEERLKKELARSHGMLNNEKFVSKAPAAKIQEERDKLAKYEQMMATVQERLAQMK